MSKCHIVGNLMSRLISVLASAWLKNSLGPDLSRNFQLIGEFGISDTFLPHQIGIPAALSHFEIKSILHMYCCGTRKSHQRTRMIRQKRGYAKFLTKLFRSKGGISLSHNNTSWWILFLAHFVTFKGFMWILSVPHNFLDFLRLFQSKN